MFGLIATLVFSLAMTFSSRCRASWLAPFSKHVDQVTLCTCKVVAVSGHVGIPTGQILADGDRFPEEFLFLALASKMAQSDAKIRQDRGQDTAVIW